MNKLIATLLALFFTTSGFAHQDPLHLPLDLDSTELTQILERSPALKNRKRAHELQSVLTWGKRNLDWLVHINSQRPAGAKLSFTSRETQRGIPIDQPNRYNPTLIKERVAAVKATLPASMARVLEASSAFPNQPPVPDAEYLDLGREVDRQYQSAARWMMLENYIGQLRGRVVTDVRGYYFLSRMADREAALRSPSAEVIEWVKIMCINSGSGASSCANTVEAAVSRNQDLNPLYDRYLAKARANFESFYKIPAAAQRSRRDLRWEGDLLVKLPFQQPSGSNANIVQAFLADNIEDEWQLDGWKLQLDFRPSGGSMPYVVFSPGVTPNVNGLGGNRITMDANQPLTEYNVQWTIRHEFGHVLGFPDCYIEFYSDAESAMINYQIDTSDLMCSRVGHLKDRHVDEMRRAFPR